MTQQDAAEQWREGARDELAAARVLLEGQRYEQALFHCHLATEKALKAAWIVAHGTEEPPHTHDLVSLAKALPRQWTDEQLTDFETLTRFVIDARYADPPWAKEYATKEHAATWLERAKGFCSLLQS